MVVLGVVELGRFQDLRGDRPVPRLDEPLLIRLARCLRGLTLALRVPVDSRPVLRSAIVALAIEHTWAVALVNSIVDAGAEVALNFRVPAPVVNDAFAALSANS